MPPETINSTSFYLRNPRVVTVTQATTVLFIAEDGEVIKHVSQATFIWSRLMQQLVTPQSGADLLAAGNLPDDADDALLEQLIKHRILLCSSDKEVLNHARDAVFTDNPGFEFIRVEPLLSNLVFACSGSIVAGLLPPTILSQFFSGLQRNLDVILTPAARQFITSDLLEHYGIRTWCDPFERRDNINVLHVALGSAAECIVVMPATASTLQRLASGACTDLLGLTVAASHCPLILSPVMNATMWNQPAIQRNVQQLRNDGASIIEPTLIFGAADLSHGNEPMYGGHGILWCGPRGLRHVVTAVMNSSPYDR